MRSDTEETVCDKVLDRLLCRHPRHKLLRVALVSRKIEYLGDLTVFCSVKREVGYHFLSASCFTTAVESVNGNACIHPPMLVYLMHNQMLGPRDYRISAALQSPTQS